MKQFVAVIWHGSMMDGYVAVMEPREARKSGHPRTEVTAAGLTTTVHPVVIDTSVELSRGDLYKMRGRAPMPPEVFG